jgi:hypothetical protein
MRVPTLIVGLALALGGCTALGDAHGPYAGEPGSTYDAAANPPQMIGTVAYDAGARQSAASTAASQASATGMGTGMGLAAPLPPRQDRH